MNPVSSYKLVISSSFVLYISEVRGVYVILP